jgi:hypothetical protein
MLKRIAVLFFILSAMVLLALVPMSVSASSTDTHKFQTTEEPPVVDETPVVGITIEVGATSTSESAIPVTGGGGMPSSTLIIFGLVAVLGIAIVLGGMALMSRRQ